MLCLVLDELGQLSLPRHIWALLCTECPLEADAAEPIDASLREQTSLVVRTLFVNPLSQFAGTALNIAVTVFRSIIEQLLEAFIPLIRRINIPLEADAVELVDAILRKRTSPVGRALVAHPLS